ncbi:exosome complex component RRP40 [Angomonas deanei]|nr:exosome complex component RRP40 [Angomonas deanei]|eukprot:EPY25332.1 exosome complex component RRP40 [Angomonas deanei]
MSVRELVPMRSHVCLPGDPVLLTHHNNNNNETPTVVIGDGLYPRGPALLSTYCAPVSATPIQNNNNNNENNNTIIKKYALASPAARRYEPREGDPVIAIVTRRQGQRSYFTWLEAGVQGYLETTAFDGATKTNYPRLKEGDAVYCYIKPTRHSSNYLDRNVHQNSIFQNKEGIEVELSCTAAEVGLPPKSWTSGEAHFGPLSGGQLLQLPLPYVKSLLTPHQNNNNHNKEAPTESSYLLELLSQHCSYEVVLGLNGYVWIRGAAHGTDSTAALRRTIAVSACLTEGQQDHTVGEMEARVASYFT